MPRRTLARRFEPRGGVTRPMLEVEAGYVAKEMEDQALRSAAELRQRLDERRKKWSEADASLRVRVESLPERERNALLCIVVRDLYHIMELYLTYLAKAHPAVAAAVPDPEVARVELPAVPFSEWLFE